MKGGLAGGPEKACGEFHDNINNYISSEYCSYYNAAFTGAVAYINKVENNLVTTSQSKTPDRFSIVPNPATNIIVVSGVGNNDDLQILDSLGKTILQLKVNNGQEVNISALSQGIYNVKIGIGEKVIKLIKK